MSRSNVAPLLAALTAICLMPAAAGQAPLRHKGGRFEPIPAWIATQIPPYVAPQFVPPHPGEGQMAYIDPVTHLLVDGPGPFGAARPDFVRLPDPAAVMRAGVTADGHLYIETNGYHETMTATIDGSGEVHVACGDPAHGHARSTPAAPATGADR
jgi:hypothetical protein